MDRIINQEFKIVKPSLDRRWTYFIAVFILFFFLENWIEQLGIANEFISTILFILIPLPALWIRTVPKNFKTIGKLKFSNETIEIKTKLSIERINITDLTSIDFRFSGTLGGGNRGFSSSFGPISKEDGSGNIITLNTEKSSYNLNIFLVSRIQKIELESILETIKNQINPHQHII